jgi:DNA-directed RNA polymerase subunit E'/Rpb7
MNTCRIIRSIEFTPDLKRINDGLLEKFKARYENTCSKSYGYILEVNRIIRTVSSKLSIYNGNLIMECEIEVRCLLPQVNAIVSGLVKQVFNQGIIVMVQGCMKAFIPSPPTASISGHAAEVGQLLEFKVSQIRFQKGKYDCIGQIGQM